MYVSAISRVVPLSCDSCGPEFTRMSFLGGEQVILTCAQQRKRFAARKKAVKDSHTANCTLVQKSITRVFDEHEEKA